MLCDSDRVEDAKAMFSKKFVVYKVISRLLTALFLFDLDVL